MESRLTLFTRCSYCILGADTAIPCAATAISCTDNVYRLCGRFYTCTCYYFVVCEPLKLRCFTPAYVQAKLDNLSQKDLDTRKLLLDRYKPPEDDPAAADPGAAAPAAAAAAPQAGISQHTTRSTEKGKDEDGPVKKAMEYDEHIRGTVPAKFSQVELLRGPAKEFNLANVQVLARVTAYLYLNEKYDLIDLACSPV